ncbi:MAG: DUF3299 domain-containing protein [Verrucomicrobia bacterium]|nr:DUF3299 domain-containing protein [Verrucomicrobiota bacterium]
MNLGHLINKPLHKLHYGRPSVDGSVRVISLLALGLLALAGVTFWILRVPRGAPDEPPASAVRGRPIARLDATNVTLETPAPAASRKRPKPGSFPQRMVQFQAQLEGAAKDTSGVTNRLEMFQANPNAPRVVLPPGAPQVGGFRGVEFAQLSAFPFALTNISLIASNNAAEAAARTLALIPAEIRALDGLKVAVRGFLLPLRMQEGLAVEFLLMRDQSLCCYGAVPKVNEWISVRATGRGAKVRMDQPVTVGGVLRVGDFRENGWLTGIYQLEAEKVLEE